MIMKNIKGKHIVASSGYYLPRHGIGVSNNEVVCSVQVSPNTLDTEVVFINIDEFLQGRKLINIEYPFLINPTEVIINNAMSSIGVKPGDQGTLGDGFAYWCMTGKYWPIDSQIFGQHLRVDRGPYYHHGIGVENNMVVHYGDPGGASKRNAIIHLTTFTGFANGGHVEIMNYKERNPLQITRNRAIATIGNNGYDLISNNCEHFATWCASGVKFSMQVNTVKKSISNALELGMGALILGAFVAAIDEE